MQTQSTTSRDAPAVIILNDTRVDRHHGCSSVMRALERGLVDAGFRIAATVPAHSDWAQDPAFQASLPFARLLVVNGEGSLHHDRPAGLRLLQAGRLGRQRGVPTALVNAAWEANGAAYVEAVRDFDLVSVRDSRSAASLHAVGVDCRIVPDLSLCSNAPVEATKREGVGYTDSVEPEVTLALDALRRQLDGQALSIHDRDPTSESSWLFLRAGVGRRDLVRPGRALRLLRARRSQWRSAGRGVDDFLRRLGRLQLLVSGRFHACSLALVTGTPFVAAGSNTGKIAALIEDAGLDGWRCTGVPSGQVITDACSRGWSTAERASLESFVQHARSEAAALFGSLPGLLR